MQRELVAGDTLTFTTSLADYLPGDGWTLTYRLVPRGGGSAQTIVSSAEGELHRLTATAAQTASWTAGDYAWSAYASKGAQRYTVESGQIVVRPDPATVAAGTDARSHARKTLAAIEAVIEGRATRDQEEYSIAGRSLKRTPIQDLLRLRDVYKREVSNELAAEQLAAGESPGYRLVVRL